MKKTFLTGIFSTVLACSALAQTATPATAGIGPAPTNTKPHHILDGALSPHTRQTLQQAMNSFPVADTTTAK
jgi:hypothetical protein